MVGRDELRENGIQWSNAYDAAVSSCRNLETERGSRDDKVRKIEGGGSKYAAVIALGFEATARERTNVVMQIRREVGRLGHGEFRALAGQQLSG